MIFSIRRFYFGPKNRTVTVAGVSLARVTASKQAYNMSMENVQKIASGFMSEIKGKFQLIDKTL